MTNMSKQEEQTFTNDDIELIYKQMENCQVTFDIKITPEKAQKNYNQAIKKVAKEVSIPGFRKGKAPASFITERYGSAIQDEFLDISLQSAFNEALKLTKTFPINATVKSPKILSKSRETGVHFTISFEKRLELPLIELDKISVKQVEPKEVTEANIEETVDSMQYRMAKFEEVKDRGLQEGDFVNIDVIIEGEVPKLIENRRVRVNESGVPKWLLSQIMGKTTGEKVTGMTDGSEDEQPLPYTAKIQEIFTAEKSELNEEFLKKIGLASEEELRAKIQDQLEKRSHDEAFEKQAYLIEQALLEKYPLSIPKTYMDAEFKARLTDYLEPLEKKGYSQLIDQDRDKIEKNIMKNATEGLTIYFILQAVAAGAKLEPTNEEISAEYNHENNRDLIMGSYFGGKEAQEELSKKMFEIAKTRKIKKYMIEQVSYN